MQLAIIIPYYKVIFFRETLQSLANQTDHRFSVYIGDDASPENPAELLREFEGKFNITYKKFEQNLGSTSLTKHWDRCLAMMNLEEWFMILGDDDYLSSNAVAEFYRYQGAAEQENITVLKLSSAIVDESSTAVYEKKAELYIKSSIEHFFDKFVYEGRSSLSEHIFRKSAYNKHGFKDLPFAWHSDDLALLEFSEYGNIMFLESAKCFVRVSAKSISGNPDKNKKEKWQASKMFFDSICQNLIKFNKDEKKKLFNLIEWYEKEKKISVEIPNKLVELYQVFGWKGIRKAFF